MLDSSRYFPAMENTKNTRVIQFGAFEIDSRAGELRKNGFKVRIQQQPLEVLMALLERPGDVVSRDELHARLWPNDTFVDFERGLNAAVRRLREALGESAEQPVFIETLSKRGYRFIGPVNGHSAMAPAVGAVDAALSKRRSKRLLIIIATAVVAMGVVLAALFFRVRTQPPVAYEQVETRLTANSEENPVGGATISPDGKYLAYSDATGLYLKLIRTGETHAIPMPPGFFAIPVGWFPDGAHLLIGGGEAQDKDRGLWSVSIYGGTPRKLMGAALSGSVSPDGRHIVALRGSPDWGDFGTEIWTMDSDGSNPTRLVSPISDSAIGAVAWGPDSKHLAYTLMEWGGHVAERATIQIAVLGQSELKTVLSDKNLGPALQWLPGRLIYTLREKLPNQRDSNVWARPVNTNGELSGNPMRLTGSPGWISTVSSSADGKHLALLKNAWTGHVFLGQLSPDGNHLVNVRRMTLEESKDLPTAWTSDSKTVLFSSDRNGHSEIFKQKVDQTQPELLASSKESLGLPRLSPDGTEVLYISVPQDTPDYGLGSILAVPLSGGVSRKITDTEAGGMGNLECTREPANFCMINTVDGQHEIFFRFDPKTGMKSELTRIDSDAPVNWGLSPDGAHLTILPYSPDNGSMTLYSIKKGTTRKFQVKGWTGLTTVDWATDSKSMFVGTLNRAGHIALLRVALDGAVHVLRGGTFPTLCGCDYWAIPSPNGKWVAMNEPAGTSNAWGLDLN